MVPSSSSSCNIVQVTLVALHFLSVYGPGKLFVSGSHIVKSASQNHDVLRKEESIEIKRSLDFESSDREKQDQESFSHGGTQYISRSTGSSYFGNGGSGGSSHHSSNSSNGAGSYSSAKSSSSSSYDRSSYGSYGSYGSSSSSKASSSRFRPSTSEHGSSSSTYGSYGNYKYQHEEPMVPLAWVILLIITSVGLGMLLTANEFINHSEGNWANFCRLSVSILDCVWKIIYNCYRCRLSEIPNIVWTGGEDDDEDAYTDQELQNMKPRPGIERALDVEHKRSMNRLRKEFEQKKTGLGKKIAKTVGVVERGPGLVAFLGERKTYMKVSTSEPLE